jgi:glycosyltransferase involved in cell wall biosynthesis
VSRNEERRRAERAARRPNKGLVCMIAYTNYIVDARVRREAETLASQGYNVLCLTTRNGSATKRFDLKGVKVRELFVPKYRGKSLLAYVGSYLSFLVVASVACARLLFEDRLDVVHVHNLPDFFVFAGLVPRLRGSKVVLDVHDSVPETFATKFSSGSLLQKALCLEERISARLAHKVICVNHPQRDALVARGIPSSKTFVSMNVPDPKIFGTPSAVGPRAARPPGFDLVYHGTMAERLGVDLVIRAAARLQDRIPGLRLNLWGHGDDLGALQSLACELRVEDRVLFKPKGFPLEDLPRQLSAMDLGVVGNRRSSAGELMLPVKLMEYIALGLPAVVPRLKAIAYYFSDDMVAFYEPEDIGSLADSIYRLHSDPGLRRRQAERAAEFLREYGWERQGVELVSFYQKLVEN